VSLALDEGNKIAGIFVVVNPDRLGPPGSRGGQNFLAVGRLSTGVPAEHSQTDMTTIARRLEQPYPDTNRGRSVAVTRLRDEMAGNVRLTLYLLLGAASNRPRFPAQADCAGE